MSTLTRPKHMSIRKHCLPLWTSSGVSKKARDYLLDRQPRLTRSVHLTCTSPSLFKSGDQLIETRHNNSVPLTGDPFQADADAKAVQQAKEMRGALLAAKEALYTIRRCISVQADALDSHIIACTLRRGARLTARRDSIHHSGVYHHHHHHHHHHIAPRLRRVVHRI